MIYVPGDNRLFGDTSVSGVFARGMASDWFNSVVNIHKILDEAQKLLEAVDLAISGADIPGDDELQKMKEAWAYMGPGFQNELEKTRSLVRDMGIIDTRLTVYSRLANIISMLTLRRQTLELNGIEVFKPV